MIVKQIHFLPFTDELLESVGGQEAYSIIDGFLGYHQTKIAKEDQHKRTFSTEWGSYRYKIMLIRLNIAPTVFSRVSIVSFNDFIHNFLEVYLYEWTVFSLLKKSVQKLRLMLGKCKQLHIYLNLKKCIFCPLLGFVGT